MAILGAYHFHFWCFLPEIVGVWPFFKVLNFNDCIEDVNTNILFICFGFSRGGEAQYPSFLTTIWFETKEPSWATKFIGKLIMQMKGEHVMFSICILKEACRKVR